MAFSMENLQKALANPSTLEEKRLADKLLTDSYGSAEVSEGNLLSLMTIKQSLDASDTGAIAALNKTAKYELEPLVQAAKLMWKDDPNSLRLRMKFGGDLRGVIALSKVIKSQSEESEARELIAEAVKDMVTSNKGYKKQNAWSS